MVHNVEGEGEDAWAKQDERLAISARTKSNLFMEAYEKLLRRGPPTPNASVHVDDEPECCKALQNAADELIQQVYQDSAADSDALWKRMHALRQAAKHNKKQRSSRGDGSTDDDKSVSVGDAIRMYESDIVSSGYVSEQSCLSRKALRQALDTRGKHTILNL